MNRRQWLQLLAAAPAAAQSYLSSPRRALTAPELKDAPDEWIERSLAWVDDMLARREEYRFTSALTPAEEPVHRAALIRLDDILHIESAPSKPLIQNWYKRRMDHTLARLEKAPKPATGIRITKLYDHGFIVDHPQGSFGIDIVRGQPNFPAFHMSPQTLVGFLNRIDALFISHFHNDHADPETATRLFAAKKPILGPADVFREVPALQNQLTVFERSVTQRHTLGNLSFIAFPGHQGKPITNNCWAITTPNGVTVMHTGDQSNDDDFAWIDNVHTHTKVDVLLPNCWTPQPLRMVAGIKPKLIVPGHENEMGHTVPHREDWTQTFDRFHNAAAPMLPLCWGESVLFG
jgi:L-ascorbate metabolism protein UlaG (beta-lactamase superfamily)